MSDVMGDQERLSKKRLFCLARGDGVPVRALAPNPLVPFKTLASGQAVVHVADHADSIR